MSNNYLGDDLKNKEAQRASLFLSLTGKIEAYAVTPTRIRLKWFSL